MSIAAKNTRQSNVEILRILAAFGVIAQHYNDGGAFFALTKQSNVLLLQFMECLWAWPVNVFVMIMGYFSYRKAKSDLKKPILLMFELVVFQTVMYCINLFGSGSVDSVTLRNVAIAVFPADYFLAIYIALYIVSPYINAVLSALSSQGRKNMLFVMLAVFSLWAYGVDVLAVLLDTGLNQSNPVSIVGDAAGHSVVNFALSYIIGSCIANGDIVIRKPALVFAAATATVAALSFVLGVSTATSYCSPLVLLQAASILSFFSGIDIGGSRIINSLAKAGITVYITHSSLLAFTMREHFMWSRPWVLAAHILLTQIALYLAGYLIHKVYTAVTDPMFRLLWKKVKLPEISANQIS